MEEIIFGKKYETAKKIVSIEPSQEYIEVFYEKDFKITSEFYPNKHWLLANQRLDQDFKRLKGDLYYKWGKLYSTRESFLKDRGRYKRQEIFSVYNSKEAAAIKDGWSCFLDMEPKDVSLLSFDLETTGLDPNDSSAKILLISAYYRGSSIQTKLFAYDEYHSQGEMILAFCDFVRQNNPSLLIGHNIVSFDLPFLRTIAEKDGVQLLLGRDGSSAVFEDFERKFRVDGSRDLPYHDCRIYGREIIDTYFLALKSDISRKYSSYGLKPIIEQEGWQLPNRTFYDASKIRENYKSPEEWNKIKKYCQDDSQDAVTLFDRFIPPFFYMTQSISKGSVQTVNQSASGSQLNSIMMRSYLQQAHSLPKADEQREFEGAISEGWPGIYNNINKLDVASLYPSIMIEYSVFPRMKDPKEIFPFLVNYFREERLKNKQLAKDTGKEYYKHLEQSQKIFANSLYGFMGAPGLLFNYVEGASEVTRRGREALIKGMTIAKDKGYIIPNVDTDSFTYGKQDGSFISEEERENFRTTLNKKFPINISWEPDGYFSKVIVLKTKNYVLWDGKKIKYKGSALRSPILEPAFKEFINRIVEAILKEETNYTEIYNDYVKEIFNIKDIKRFATRKTISSKTLTSERTNESKVRDAMEDSEYVEGDRIYCFTKAKLIEVEYEREKKDKDTGIVTIIKKTKLEKQTELCLVENFDGDYDIDCLLKKLYNTSIRFETIFQDHKELFVNYSLKRNYGLLNDFSNKDI